MKGAVLGESWYLQEMLNRSMHRAFTFFIVINLICCAAIFSGCGMMSLLGTSESERFERFAQDYFTTRSQQRGGESSDSDRLSVRADSVRTVSAKEALTRLRSIDTTRLLEDKRIDWLQLEAAIKRTLRDTILQEPVKIPGRYVTVGNLYWQVLGDRNIPAREWKEILRTLGEVPAVVKLGKKQLHQPPPLWVRLAGNTIRRNEEFLGGLFRERIAVAAPDSVKAELLASAERAKEALAGFRHFLEDSLKLGEETSWAVGSSYYDWLLKEVHFLPYNAEELIAEGWRIHKETKEALTELARRVDQNKSVPQLVEEMKSRHPSAGTIIEAYRRESDRARALLVSRQLISIPEPETLMFVPTPPALRETYAWAGYGGIQMRDSIPTGRFFVTDVVPEMSESQVHEKLRAQNNGWITVIALHEGYPGHHLQSLYARRNPNQVRSRLGSTYYGEGWALYTEAWMARLGFYKNADDSLAWLQMRLWRTARVIVDPSIHIGWMTYEQAVQFMVEEVGLERSAAEAEANRYTTWPTQAPSYIIGWLEIEKLKRELEIKLGDRFDERHFAETLLSVGSLPLELLKRAMMDRYRSRVDPASD